MDKNIPIYQKIEKDLRIAIIEGHLKQGDMIPSETELSARYNVTRMTVRQAINNLLIDGYIYKHKGRGTFVTFDKKEMNQKEPSFSFYREMIGIDASVETKVINIAEIEADEIVAKKLQLTEKSTVYYIERIRESNNVALVYERLYLPRNMYNEINEEILSKSFHEYIEKHLNFKIKNAIRAIEARPLNEKVADLLHQTPGEPSLYMSSVTYLENGRACMYTRQYFHGNHFRFVHNFEK